MKIALPLLLSLFASSTLAATPQATAPDDRNKPAVVTLSIQDWQAVLASIGDSGSVSARDANRIGHSIVSQVQSQIAPSQSAQKR
jgi:hypothetical protein